MTDTQAPIGPAALADYLALQARTVARDATRQRATTPFDTWPAELAPLPTALSAAHRVGLFAPLSTLRALLLLTESKAARGLERVAQSDPVEALARLFHPGRGDDLSRAWPAEARVAAVLVLLKFMHDDDQYTPDERFRPPEGATPGQLYLGLLQALDGPVVAPDEPDVPADAVERATARIDDALFTLFEALGPQACADDPTLPVGMLERLGTVVPLGHPHRTLLGRRLPSDTIGRAQGAGFGMVREGLAHRGDLRSLLPSAWAMPREVQAYRYLCGDLLYRARVGREPPRMRPTVLVIDASACCIGPIADVLRPAAFALANALIAARQPAVLLSAGGDNEVIPLVEPRDAFEALAAWSIAPVDVARTMAQARGLRETLRGDGAYEPVIVLMTHTFFGEEDQDVASPHGLRALFAEYPDRPVLPSWRGRCERWNYLGHDEMDAVPDVVARLMA